MRWEKYALMQRRCKNAVILDRQSQKRGVMTHDFAKDNKPWPAEAKTKARARKHPLTSEHRESDELLGAWLACLTASTSCFFTSLSSTPSKSFRLGILAL